MRDGIFITFEGPDGSGKSTQIKLLSEYLIGMGLHVTVTREPGGTKIGENIRDIILSNDNTEMTPMTEMLLYAASRSQHIVEVIRPALEGGDIVICDRFTDSSLVYQGAARGLGDVVDDVNKYVTEDITPDLTILLLADPKLLATRMEDDVADRIEAEGTDYQELVCSAYTVLAEKFKNRIFKIDAGLPADVIHEKIISHPVIRETYDD